MSIHHVHSNDISRVSPLHRNEPNQFRKPEGRTEADQMGARSIQDELNSLDCPELARLLATLAQLLQPLQNFSAAQPGESSVGGAGSAGPSGSPPAGNTGRPGMAQAENPLDLNHDGVVDEKDFQVLMNLLTGQGTGGSDAAGFGTPASNAGAPSMSGSGSPPAGGPSPVGGAPAASGPVADALRADSAPAASAIAPAGPAATVTAVSSGPTTGASSLAEASRNTHPIFAPILRGDEAASDAKVKTQADFGQLVDKTAKEYGLDPNQLRAEMEQESSAFSKGFQQAMHAEGDLERKGENNTSIGIGQISRQFLDGGKWSDSGPNSAKGGGRTVSSEQYNNSVTTQVRVMASNLAQRVDSYGSLEKGLAFYVHGSPDTSQEKAAHYLNAIDMNMKRQEVVNVGR